MKRSLRARYFNWLLFLILIIYAVIFAAFINIELYEAYSQRTKFGAEIKELIVILLVMLITLPISLLAAWHISDHILKPLTTILKTAEQIGKGKLDERIPVISDPPQLSRLAITINEAFDRYADSVTRFENFSSNASHQLRTPLAAIRTTAEVNLQSDRSPEDYRDAIGQILEQTHKLNQTIDQLMILSRLDSAVRESFSSISLASVIRKWTGSASEVFEDRTITLNCTPEVDNLTIAGNETLLKDAFDNLLNNAIAATTEGGTITIHIKTCADGLEWMFEDSGPGLPEYGHDKIFDRFYRGPETNYSGAGLGLAIVKQIVLLHGGSIHAGNSQALGGALFSITLPAC